MPSKHPTPLLAVLVHDLASAPGLTGLCVGYEDKEWREKQLASHVMTWLLDFALKHSEIEGLGPHNAMALIAQAAKSIYATDKYKKRGEFGEILLHMVIRQCFKTVPAISKFYYKDSRNSTVKGFDAVHVVASARDLELWLGEVKFYADVTKAISAVVKEIEDHTKRDYLRGEFAAITTKIDDTWPHAAQLKTLLHPNTSLDAIFRTTCIPVLLTYDSAVIKTFDEASAAYATAFEKEVRKHCASFAQALGKATLPARLRVHLFLLPLRDKASLTRELHEALRRTQEIL